MLALLWGYPLWWALGVASYIWIVAAVVGRALALGSVPGESPPGFGLWLLFLGWMLLSGTQVELGSSILVYGYRTAIYIASGVLMLYVYNLSAATRRHGVTAMAAFWVMAIGFGLVTLVVPELRVRQPLRADPAGGLASNNFIRQLSRPSLAQIHDFLGYPVPAPPLRLALPTTGDRRLRLARPLCLVWSRPAPRVEAHPRRRIIGLAALIPDRPVAQPWPLDQPGGRLSPGLPCGRAPGPGQDTGVAPGGGRHRRRPDHGNPPR